MDLLRDQSKRISNHAKLAAVEPTLIGNLVNVAFVYETGDAAGQNMTTACTWACCQWLLEQMKNLEAVRIEDFIIEANMSGDKKVTYQSFIAGRGIRVTAETNVTAEVLSINVTGWPEVNTGWTEPCPNSVAPGIPICPSCGPM